MVILRFAFKCAENCIRMCICDDWKVDLIARERGDQVGEDDSSGDEEGIEEPAAPAAIPTKVALGHVGELVSFVLLAYDPSMVEAATKLQTIVQEHSIRLPRLLFYFSVIAMSLGYRRTLRRQIGSPGSSYADVPAMSSFSAFAGRP